MITLYASNSRGYISATKQDAFTTPAHPIIEVHLSTNSIIYGRTQLQMTIRLRGTFDPERAPRVYLAKFPRGPIGEWPSADSICTDPVGRGVPS